MKFTCTTENLKKGLAVVSGIAGKNVTLPVLNNILLEAQSGELKLSSTNLEIGIRVLVRGKIEQGGAVTVPAKLFSDYVGLLRENTVTVSLDAGTLHVESGVHTTSIRTLPAEDYPLIPLPAAKEDLEVDAQVFRKAVIDVLFAASHDDMRPELSGVLFSFQDGRLVMASTDSYRLAEKVLELDTKGFAGKNVILPLKMLHEMVRVLDQGDERARLILGDNQVLLGVGGVVVVSRLIEGVFPDYKQIIPTQTLCRAVFDREALVSVVRVASLFTKTGINDVLMQFQVEGGGVLVSTTNTQLGENTAQIDAELSGESVSVLFNWRYLLDGLTAITTKKISFEISSESGPGMLRPDKDTTYLYLIMPIKQ